MPTNRDADASSLTEPRSSVTFYPLFLLLEAVGQMALTNYIMQSVICTLVFFGYGLNYYAELEFYQIYFVVLAIWALQLIVSPLWLRYFLYGPLEWVWRSLTYWCRQPFSRPRGKLNASS
jgi:uncharacterized protein